MRKYFSVPVFVFSLVISLPFVQSCCSKKNISANEKKTDSTDASLKSIPGDLTVSPSHFRVDATVINFSAKDSIHPRIVYTLLIRHVLARGSSITHFVAGGDTIDAVLPANVSESSAPVLKKGEEAVALLEDRLQPEPGHVVFYLKTIRKK